MKSHLIPRALLLDVKKNNPYLVSGKMDRVGVRFLQNGEWDDEILCKEHEDKIGAGDDHAVKLLRSAIDRSTTIEEGHGISVPNKRPDLMIHFVYACVWRTVMSTEGRRLKKNLGPYEKIIRNALLLGGAYDLPVFAGLHRLSLKGRPLDLASYPYRSKFYELNCWKFICGKFDFTLILDKRSIKEGFRPYLINENQNLIISISDPLELHDARAFAPVLGLMRQRR